MKYVWNYVFVLIWIASLISSGVYLFSRGFLLSRVSKEEVSTCRHLSTDPNEEYYLNEEIVKEIFKDVNASSNLCLPKKSKVIILVIDALKYEFGLFKPDLANPLPYQNKLKIFNELLVNEPDRSRLLRFRADPPTTTLQRLKGLTTGSLPTFIDIGSNFASPEINEDNVIDQMVNNGLSAVFMGDSTWTDLYPKRFKRKYSYPSFDIFDLDTVDNEIRKHLPRELIKDDWDVLIAHFLGVDHCGHRFGPLHTEMSRKLTEMDDAIRSVVDQMDNETTLLIMGDHGMTISGDHGGESDDEINALLFAYSKAQPFVSSEFGSDNTTMQQIDLVPTLSSILGIPIPYSNLGLINFNVVPSIPLPHLSEYQTLLLHAWQNANQIYTYFYNYALENKRTFNFDEMDDLESKFLMLSMRVNSIYNEEAFKSFIADLNANLREVLHICRDNWVKFDATQMSHGLLITFLPIFFSFLLINNSKASQFPRIFTTKVVSYTSLLLLASAVFGYRFFADFSLKSEVQGVIFFTGIQSTLILVFLTFQNWSDIAVNWSQMKRVGNIPTRLIYIFFVTIFFSNSFVIQEQKILSYLLIAIILVLLYEIVQNSLKSQGKTRLKFATFTKSAACKVILVGVLAIVLIRCAYSVFRCREEQGNCEDFATNSDQTASEKGSQRSNFRLNGLDIVAYVYLTRLYLRSCGNLTGTSANVILAFYGPIIAGLCAVGHILLSSSSMKNVLPSHIDALALIVYAIFVIQILVLIISPLMTFVLPPKTGLNGRPNDIPVVFGLATIYSSILISFGVFLALVLSVLLGPNASFGIAICIGVGAAILTIHSYLRYRTATDFETCIQPTFTAIVSWLILSHFCFFSTSHQTTLSQIDWRAATIGRSSNFDHSNFISGILVFLNTFCGQFLFMSLYGLLGSVTFSLHALFPSKAPREKKTEGNPDFRTTTINRNADLSAEAVGFDISRGELTIFENERIYLGTVFKLAVQFFMLQGIRVFCAMMACTIHCRHLMVWKIFAPRFIYEGFSTFIAFPAIILGFLIIIRVHWSVDRLITHINKIK